ncbi:hypothetical protein WKH79_12490 [Qipengyuania sp. GPGPB31]|uniref:hypothetical protein n=1 Tax=Qipengyuania sp. GPGPB31 TaxID=3023518 RepID=UPI0031345EEC
MGYNMNIPQVRKRLFEIAEETNNEELAYLANELHQKQMKKKAPIKSDEFTPELAEEIRDFAAAHPKMHNQEIANAFNVNIGRVTDAMQGKI